MPQALVCDEARTHASLTLCYTTNMAESGPKESYVEPSLLEKMTPEGRDLVQRVLNSTDLVISITENHQKPGNDTESRIAEPDVAPRKIATNAAQRLYQQVRDTQHAVQSQQLLGPVIRIPLRHRR